MLFVVLWAELCCTAEFCQKPAVTRQLPKGVWQNLAEHKMSGGRTFSAIVTENFTVSKERTDKSNHYELKCNHCSAIIINHDNNHIKHISDARMCPSVPAKNQQCAMIFLAGKNINNNIIMSIPAAQMDNDDTNGAAKTSIMTVQVIPIKQKIRETLAGLVDFPLTDHQKQCVNVKLFQYVKNDIKCTNVFLHLTRFIVHMNLPFQLSKNWYFQDFLCDLHPLYTSPSRYVISHSIMDSKAARVCLEELDCVKKSKKLTYLIDGWEDLLKQSIYRSVAAEVGKYPTMLSLEDMTGNQAMAEGIMDAAEKAMQEMDLLDGKHFIAVTTDNPTVMQAFQRKFQSKYFWVLVHCYHFACFVHFLRYIKPFACFLHQLNTLISDICAYPPIKKIITQATCTVTFFNSSHYWGEQVKEEAKSCKITCGLKKNCELRFYAISLLCNSVIKNQYCCFLFFEL